MGYGCVNDMSIVSIRYTGTIHVILCLCYFMFLKKYLTLVLPGMYCTVKHFVCQISIIKKGKGNHKNLFEASIRVHYRIFRNFIMKKLFFSIKFH